MMKINKNYKVVNVYSGYGEFGVESIKVVKGSFIEEVCVKINKESLKSMLKGSESKEDKVISYGFWDEFFNDHNILCTSFYFWNSLNLDDISVYYYDRRRHDLLLCITPC